MNLGKVKKDIKNVVVYGFGNVGQKCITRIRNDFNILVIIDNDVEKQGIYDGKIRIEGESFIKSIEEDFYILVMTGGKQYNRISENLIRQGYKEYEDFCDIETFIAAWYWECKKENCLLEVHTAVTMKCTFRCKNCNMFIPYYKEFPTYSLAELKLQYDMLFQYVDYIFSVTILGGEPLLYKELGELLLYLKQEYGKRIGTLNIISNGGISPSEKLLDVLKETDTLVYISDYTKQIAYKDKLNQVESVLQEKGIRYWTRASLEWKDFGFPICKPEIDAHNSTDHMKYCSPLFHGLNDYCFYYCHVAWSAEKAGLWELREDDYIDLRELSDTEKDKRSIIRHALGMIEGGSVSLCNMCGGCGADNKISVPAALQVKNECV